jgi:3-oxoacyl-[acyl-carrier protein] reductase
MNALFADQVESCVARCTQELGRLDILINNAGGSSSRNFADSIEKSWRKHIDINLVSMLAATHAAIKSMRAGGRGGVILNIASVEGLRGSPGLAVYAACKAAMINFTQSMAAELADDGIRVNALAPDIVLTPGMSRFGVDSPQLQTARERYIPLRRMGTQDDYGALVAFLCSDVASYLTGITVRIDGGSLAAPGFLRSAATGQWGVLHA